MLIRHRLLPAETFAAGPPSGQFEDQGSYGLRLPQPRFAQQPIQGVSSIKPGPRHGSWWALSDNGFGSKWNSLDYRTCIYLFDSELRLLKRIELRDPQRKFPYALILEGDPARPLTGGDIDPESLVVMADGSFWIGDEFGPWLLHFSPNGHLLAAPVASSVSYLGELHSPNHPRALEGRATANVKSSSGFEGLTSLGRGASLRLYALLERPLTSETDPRDLRLLEFDPAQLRWTGREWRYRLESAGYAAGELATTPDGDLLVIEHDGLQGAATRSKMVFRLASPVSTETGAVLKKTPLIDLLALSDPQHLAGFTDILRFSYASIESIHALDRRTWVVVNDNNFPSSGGRGNNGANPTEWLWIRASD